MRHVPAVSITLSTVPSGKHNPGFQPPLPPEMVKAQPGKRCTEIKIKLLTYRRHKLPAPAAAGDGRSTTQRQVRSRPLARVSPVACMRHDCVLFCARERALPASAV